MYKASRCRNNLGENHVQWTSTIMGGSKSDTSSMIRDELFCLPVSEDQMSRCKSIPLCPNCNDDLDTHDHIHHCPNLLGMTIHERIKTRLTPN